MKKKSHYLFSTCILFASTLPTCLQAETWHPFASLGLGFTETSHTQDLTLIPTPTPGRTDRFISKSTSHTTVLVSAGGERILKNINDSTELWFGVEGGYLQRGNVQGQVLPSINVGNFDQLNFTYDMDSFVFLAKGKLKKRELFNTKWSGYIDVGIGLGINRFLSYQETIPTGSTTLPLEEPFKDDRNLDFAYSIGFGIAHSVGNRSELSVGYRYLNSGKGSLGTTPIQTTQNHLQSRTLGTHLLTMTVRV